MDGAVVPHDLALARVSKTPFLFSAASAVYRSVALPSTGLHPSPFLSLAAVRASQHPRGVGWLLLRPGVIFLDAGGLLFRSVLIEVAFPSDGSSSCDSSLFEEHLLLRPFFLRALLISTPEFSEGFDSFRVGSNLLRDDGVFNIPLFAPVNSAVADNGGVISPSGPSLLR